MRRNQQCCESVLVVIPCSIAFLLAIYGFCFTIIAEIHCPEGYTEVMHGYCMNHTILSESIEPGEIVHPMRSTGKQFLMAAGISLMIAVYNGYRSMKDEIHAFCK